MTKVIQGGTTRKAVRKETIDRVPCEEQNDQQHPGKNFMAMTVQEKKYISRNIQRGLHDETCSRKIYVTSMCSLRFYEDNSLPKDFSVCGNPPDQRKESWHHLLSQNKGSPRLWKYLSFYKTMQKVLFSYYVLFTSYRR